MTEGFDTFCFDVGFQMDCGAAMEEHYPGSTQSAENLEFIIHCVTDIDLLGSAIFSKWRYYTHWDYDMNAILSDEAREWFITAFARLEELASIPVFDGTLDKIRIVSNVMGFGPEPMPEEEVEQHIIIHRNGQVWISRYVFGDWTSGHKKKAANRINIGDAAGKVLDSIASYSAKLSQ